MSTPGDRGGARPTVRDVVVVLIRHRGRLLLLRRSSEVGREPRRWHWLSGHLPAGTDPKGQARQELAEEAGLSTGSIRSLRACGRRSYVGDDGEIWRVHGFIADVTRSDVELNWENSEYRWVRLRDVADISDGVTWLSPVCADIIGRTQAPSRLASGTVAV